MEAYRPYPGVPFTQEQKQFNTKMSEMRICVEHGLVLFLSYGKLSLLNMAYVLGHLI
jgi:hypothetical protein